MENSDSIYHQGLLLMRLTGLRIGELCSLERNCIRRDHLNNCFLKVPLGKLNTERLVPMDAYSAERDH
jgi:integrase